MTSAASTPTKSSTSRHPSWTSICSRSDRPLQDAVAANGARNRGRSARRALANAGARPKCSSEARLANENLPRLRTFDAKGHRRDMVEFHPAYHHFMRESIGDGLAAMTWDEHGDARPARRREVARAARYYMVAQVENGHMCPVTMTRAAVAALAAARRRCWRAWCRRSCRA